MPSASTRGRLKHCRRSVIRAYHDLAIKRKVRFVILGMNEWAGLSGDKFSGIRKLQPFGRAVYVVHLPYLLGKTIKDMAKTLKNLGWDLPEGESLVEANTNSCLFAGAAQKKAREMLDFHPDCTRLSREVTVGFINKEQATKALDKVQKSEFTVREILKKAEII